MDLLDATRSLVTADPKATIALLSPFVTYGINRNFSPSVRLFHSIRHQFHYILNTPIVDESGIQVRPTQSVVVQSLSIVNAGRAPAKGVEIVFNWRPSYVNTWPIRKYEEFDHPDGRYSIHLDNLAPKESFGLELLCVNMELPNVITARSQETESRPRSMMLQVHYSNWFNGIVAALMFSGIIATVYAILSILAFALT